MTTTRAPKSGPTRVTHRGYRFWHGGEEWQIIDNGPVTSSVWAVRSSDGQPGAFKITKGEVTGRVTQMAHVYVRRHVYGPLASVPYKVCTAADFR